MKIQIEIKLDDNIQKLIKKLVEEFLSEEIEFPKPKLEEGE